VKVNVLSHCLLRAGMDSGRLEREREREVNEKERAEWVYQYRYVLDLLLSK
jgi:hypothetical protein